MYSKDDYAYEAALLIHEFYCDLLTCSYNL
jgi:hypothetical protein